MKVAYHFDADAHGYSYGPDIDRLFLKALGEAPPGRLHVRIKRGDLLLHLHLRDAGEREVFIRERIIHPEHPVWMTLDPSRFPSEAARRSIYIVYVDGISPGEAKLLDRRLKQDGAYLGSLEIHLGNSAHWALYGERLVSAYRVVGRELRLLHIASELEPELPTGDMQDWIESGLFDTVEFEDTGLQETLFDPYRTLGAAQREAELEDLLAGHFSAVVTETLIRTGELDPLLREALHAALTSFESFGSSEQLAQVGTSCRRFLERLADAVYPARAALRNGREVTHDKYRNRLWAYVDETLKGSERDLVVSTLADIGKRIDRLNDLASKGVHAPKVSPSEMHRLLVGLVQITYDVLTLAPPPKKARMEPYVESLIDVAAEIFGDPSEPADS